MTNPLPCGSRGGDAFWRTGDARLEQTPPEKMRSSSHPGMCEDDRHADSTVHQATYPEDDCHGYRLPDIR